MADFKLPIALPGRRVWVHNYKKKRKNNGQMEDANIWELGKVVSTETVWDKNGGYRHKYTVFLDRQVQEINRNWCRTLKLYVSEEQISLVGIS